MSRPEYQLPADVYYGAEEARRYARSSRMQAIQTQLAERALELLLLPCKEVAASSPASSPSSPSSAGAEASMVDTESEGGEEQSQRREKHQAKQQQQQSLLLDLGVGSGISASCLVEKGHFVVGVDISRFMLDEAVALGNTEERTDVLRADLGQRLNFRPAVFDGAISISALQWLCSGVQSSPMESRPTFASATIEAADAERAHARSSGRGDKETNAAWEEGQHSAEAGPVIRRRVVTAQAGMTTHTHNIAEESVVDAAIEEDQEEAEAEGCRDTQIHMFTGKPSTREISRSVAHAGGTGGGGPKSNTPYGRLRRFFAWLYASLRPGARAALQFYPDSTEQVETITAAALRAGFNGGLVVDYPNSSKAKKHFLVLWVGGGYVSTAEQQRRLQNAAVDSRPQNHVLVARREREKRMKKRGRKAGGLTRRQWIMKKKEKHRLQVGDVDTSHCEKSKTLQSGASSAIGQVAVGSS